MDPRKDRVVRTIKVKTPINTLVSPVENVCLWKNTRLKNLPLNFHKAGECFVKTVLCYIFAFNWHWFILSQ